ncbi:hypothetical protein [Sinomicrobium sp. M5D2P17]
MKALERFAVREMNFSELEDTNGGSLVELNLDLGGGEFLFEGDIILSDYQLLYILV